MRSTVPTPMARVSPDRIMNPWWHRRQPMKAAQNSMIWKGVREASTTAAGCESHCMAMMSNSGVNPTNPFSTMVTPMVRRQNWRSRTTLAELRLSAVDVLRRSMTGLSKNSASAITR